MLTKYMCNNAYRICTCSGRENYAYCSKLGTVFNNNNNNSDITWYENSNKFVILQLQTNTAVHNITANLLHSAVC